MKVKVVIGRTETFLSSVGLDVGGVRLLASKLQWENADTRRRIIEQVLEFCRQLDDEGVGVVEGIEELEALLKEGVRG